MINSETLNILWLEIAYSMIDRVAEKIDMMDRHLGVLTLVMENEPIGIVRTSDMLDYPHHKVRYTFRVLEEEELIESTPQGAITTERTHEVIGDLNERLTDLERTLSSMTDTGEKPPAQEEPATERVVAPSSR